MAMVDFTLSHNSTLLLIELNTRFKRNGRLLLDAKDDLELRVEKTHFTLQDLNSELQIIQTTQNDVRARVEELHGRHDTEETMQKRQRILDWLTPVDHALQQRDGTNRWQPGTGGWLLCSQMYQD
jgi:chromosome segregation ATPase